MKTKDYHVRVRLLFPVFLASVLLMAMEVWATPGVRTEQDQRTAQEEEEKAREEKAQEEEDKAREEAAREEKDKAQEELEKAREEADSLEHKRDDTQKQARELEDQLTRLLMLSSLLESDMEELKQQIETAEHEYETAVQNREQRYEMLKKRIRFLYEEGNITYLDILLRARNIGDVVNQTEYFSQLYQYDQEMITQYEEIRVQVLEKKARLEGKQSEMEVMEQEYGGQQTQIRSMIRQTERESETFSTQLTEARERAAGAADKVRLKNEEIRRLRKQAEARRSEEDRSREEARRREMIKSHGGTSFGREVADYGLQFVGNPYVYGGTSLTKGADCSGFTQSVYRHFGVNIPRTSGEQAVFGREVSYEDMEPGDLVCYSGHVAMYIGDGRIVHASSTKEGIKVGYDPAYRTIVSVRRPWQS